MNNKKPPSNAREIQMPESIYNCTSCHCAFPVVSHFHNPEPKRPSVLCGRSRAKDIYLCDLCFLAYRHTVQANGWVFVETKKYEP